MDIVHEQTEAKLAIMEKKLRAIYHRESKELAKAWKSYLKKAGEELKTLQRQYDVAKNSGDAMAKKKAGIALQKAKKEQTLQNRRFKALTEQATEQLANVNQQALDYINGRTPEIYALNYNAFPKIVDGVKDLGYTFALVDENTVKDLLMDEQFFKQIDKYEDMRWNAKKIKSEVLQGILQGESMDKIADRFQKVVNMNEESAIKNARTLVTSAENGGRQASYKKAHDDGVIVGKYWISTRGSRTRPWHAEASGRYSYDEPIPYDKTFDVDGEELMFPADAMHGATGRNLYNCRCSMGARVIGFANKRTGEVNLL